MHTKDARDFDLDRLHAEIERLRSGVVKQAMEIRKLRAALGDARELVAGMAKPAAPGIVGMTISSYHPCHALLDKIDAALGDDEQSAREGK